MRAASGESAWFTPR